MRVLLCLAALLVASWADSSGLLTGDSELARYSERVRIIHDLIKQNCPKNVVASIDVVRRDVERSVIDQILLEADRKVEKMLYEKLRQVLIDCQHRQQMTVAPTRPRPDTTTRDSTVTSTTTISPKATAKTIQDFTITETTTTSPTTTMTQETTELLTTLKDLPTTTETAVSPTKPQPATTKMVPKPTKLLTIPNSAEVKTTAEDLPTTTESVASTSKEAVTKPQSTTTTMAQKTTTLMTKSTSHEEKTTVEDLPTTPEDADSTTTAANTRPKPQSIFKKCDLTVSVASMMTIKWTSKKFHPSVKTCDPAQMVANNEVWKGHLSSTERNEALKAKCNKEDSWECKLNKKTGEYNCILYKCKQHHRKPGSSEKKASKQKKASHEKKASYQVFTTDAVTETTVNEITTASDEETTSGDKPTNTTPVLPTTTEAVTRPRPKSIFKDVVPAKCDVTVSVASMMTSKWSSKKFHPSVKTCDPAQMIANNDMLKGQMSSKERNEALKAKCNREDTWECKLDNKAGEYSCILYKCKHSHRKPGSSEKRASKQKKASHEKKASHQVFTTDAVTETTTNEMTTTSNEKTTSGDKPTTTAPLLPTTTETVTRPRPIFKDAVQSCDMVVSVSSLMKTKWSYKKFHSKVKTCDPAKLISKKEIWKGMVSSDERSKALKSCSKTDQWECKLDKKAGEYECQLERCKQNASKQKKASHKKIASEGRD